MDNTLSSCMYYYPYSLTHPTKHATAFVGVVTCFICIHKSCFLMEHCTQQSCTLEVSADANLGLRAAGGLGMGFCRAGYGLQGKAADWPSFSLLAPAPEGKA